MKLNLFLLCLTAGVSITMQAVRRDYFLITTPSTWRNADSYCKRNNKTLAVIDTADDWYRLTTEAERKGLPVTGWIGISNNYYWWYWTNSRNPVGTANTGFIWNPGQPDNLGGNEKCVAAESNGYFADYPCTDLKPFICYDGTFVPITSLTLAWEDSRQYCRTNYIDMACPKTATEHTQIQNLGLTQSFWIGIYRTGWYWVSGPWAYNTIQWAPGHPNNAEYHNDCGAVNNSLIVDKLCDLKLYFFCYKENTTKRQVMKLRILGDNSVFDPATQSAILQKIEQKLKDYGRMREYNVTWRVRADGNIFHKESDGEL